MISAIYRRSILGIAILVSTLCIVAVGAFSLPHTAQSQGVTTQITGFAWSDNIGWISLNCSTDPKGCATPAGNWGLSATNGTITGFAWSDSIGWISTSVSGCPSGTCPPSITSSTSGGVTTYTLSGWLKALSADNKGWDGWISLSGASPSYGVTATSCNLAGNAWGSDVIGWIDFTKGHINSTVTDQVTCTLPDGAGVYHNIHDVHTDSSCVVTNTDTPCPSPQYCVTGDLYCHWPQTVSDGILTVSPKIVTSGAKTTVSWSTKNVKASAANPQGCKVTGTNGDVFNGTLIGNNTSGSYSSSPITQATTYTIACTPLDPGQNFSEPPQTVNVAPVFQER